MQIPGPRRVYGAWNLCEGRGFTWSPTPRPAGWFPAAHKPAVLSASFSGNTDCVVPPPPTSSLKGFPHSLPHFPPLLSHTHCHPLSPPRQPTATHSLHLVKSSRPSTGLNPGVRPQGPPHWAPSITPSSSKHVPHLDSGTSRPPGAPDTPLSPVSLSPCLPTSPGPRLFLPVIPPRDLVLPRGFVLPSERRQLSGLDLPPELQT